jgi:1-acyl-sn-glycerol-3-phosphate acyltransferase
LSRRAELDTGPDGYHYGPRYRITPAIVLRAAAYVLAGRRRLLSHDASIVVRAMPRHPISRDAGLIPLEGRFVVVGNHYERPGLWMAWPAMLVSYTVAQVTGREVRWIAIQEWEAFSLWGIPIPRGWIRRLFRRAFATYGIIAMAPPDAPRSSRAASIRSAVEELRGGETLGLMPEGTVGTTPELLEAREGAGSFLLLLAASSARLLPVGIYEEGESLVAQFGEPFELKPPPQLSREAGDSWARDETMKAIRNLLPPQLWGAYRDDGPSKTHRDHVS